MNVAIKKIETEIFKLNKKKNNYNFLNDFLGIKKYNLSNKIRNLIELRNIYKQVKKDEV